MSEMAWTRVRMFFGPTHQDLADIFGRRDFDFENCHFGDFLDLRYFGLCLIFYSPFWGLGGV